MKFLLSCLKPKTFLYNNRKTVNIQKAMCDKHVKAAGFYIKVLSEELFNGTVGQDTSVN